MSVCTHGVQDTAIALCEAAYKGDLESIVTLVENGVDPNLSDYDGRTALHLAASEGVVKVLDYLLSFEPKIDVNPVDVTGGTPLDDAIRHQQEVARTMLVKAGGFTKDDPRLQLLQEQQDKAKAKQAKEMRMSKVDDTSKASKEVAYYETFEEIFATFNKTDEKAEEAADEEDEVGEEEQIESGFSTCVQRVERLEAFTRTFLQLVESNTRSLSDSLQGFNSTGQAREAVVEAVQLPNQVLDVPEDVASEGSLKINICSAAHLPQMDFMGACDAFCEVGWQGQVFKTSVVKNSLNPTWEETFTFPITKPDDFSALGDVILVLKDWNSLSAEQVVGIAKIGKEFLGQVCGDDDAGWHHLSLELIKIDHDQPSGLPCFGKDGVPSLVEVRMQCVFPQQGALSLISPKGLQSTLPRVKTPPRGLDLKRLSAQTQELLEFLSSIYSALPEISDATPRLYHMAAVTYKQKRAQVMDSILRAAQLLMHVSSSIERTTSAVHMADK